MPSLKAIRTRIASVKNTQKITKAMKLVAAARLRRAQDSIVAARPYAGRMRDIMNDVTARLQLEASEEDSSHPLLRKRPIKNVRLIIVSSDRGLAGGFNSNLFRRIERLFVDEREMYASVDLSILGRKGREHFKRRTFPGVRPGADLSSATSETALARARELAQQCTEEYLEGKIDAVVVAYNEFKSAISQTVKVEQLLPIDLDKKVETEHNVSLIEFEYEPSKADVLSTLVPLYIEVELYRVVLESIASFFGAQMTAMDNATKNAKEMIGRLTLEFNRARQAAITKELMEIVGGAEALKG